MVNSSKEITFDRFIRGLLFVGIVGVVLFFLYWLSPILIPFIVAWVLAWMLMPIVKFFQVKCRFRSRALSVVATLIVVGGALTGIVWMGLPPFIEGITYIKDETLSYIQSGNLNSLLPEWTKGLIDETSIPKKIEELLRKNDLIGMVKNAIPQAWNMLVSTMGILMGIFSSSFAVLYLVLLLVDYEKFSEKWVAFLPKRIRAFSAQLMHDVEHNMRGYFRGQALIAIWNSALFSLGFWIIGLPMPIGLGCFVGVISFVPYIQILGFIPAALLALIKMSETGASFWMLMLLVAVVYVVVQIIQDVYVTPKIMGDIMGLSPAIILLSLSVWGYMAGFVGLIIALPLTTIIIDYYQRYVIGDEPLPQ